MGYFFYLEQERKYFDTQYMCFLVLVKIILTSNINCPIHIVLQKALKTSIWPTYDAILYFLNQLYLSFKKRIMSYYSAK